MATLSTQKVFGSKQSGFGNMLFETDRENSCFLWGRICNLWESYSVFVEETIFDMFAALIAKEYSLTVAAKENSSFA